jgi:hypothetical protein
MEGKVISVNVSGSFCSVFEPLKSMFFRLLLLSFVVGLPRFAICGPQSPNATVDDSPNGFERQYRDFFKAYMNGQEKLMQSRLAEFALPAGWFTRKFGVEPGAEIAIQYSEQFKDFKSSTLRRLANIYRCRRCLVSVQTKRVYGTEIHSFLSTENADGDSATPVFDSPPIQDLRSVM